MNQPVGYFSVPRFVVVPLKAWYMRSNELKPVRRLSTTHKRGRHNVSGYHPAKGGNPPCRIIAWSRAAPINGETEQIGEGEIWVTVTEKA